MKRLFVLGAALALVAATTIPSLAQTVIPPPQPNTCSLPDPAFCDRFDTEGGGAPRNGELPEWWGVSRVLGGGSNTGQGQYNAWADTNIVTCSGTERVNSGRDVQICNGELRQALNDAGDVAVLAMYPKVPFDFAGRTGRITFDVTNDTKGMHTEWPELWVTDQPVPAPFTHLGSWKATPRHGFGLRLGAATSPGTGGNFGSFCPSDNQWRWSVDSVSVSRNYVIDDSTESGHQTNVVRTGCVTAGSGPNGPKTHIEVTVNQGRIEIFATDAGSTQLKQIAYVPNANLTFTRGLIWIEDAHYNASKFGGETEHTFTWDNVGFDGPKLPRDVTFDEPDALTPISGGKRNLGYLIRANQPRTMLIPIMHSTGLASAAYLLTNFYSWQSGTIFTYVVNGNSHTVPWPYPAAEGFTPRTHAFPIPLGELHDGANTVTFGSNVEIVQMNGGIVLAGVLGSAPPTSTAMPTVTSTSVPTATVAATATTAPTAAPTATSEPTATPTATATPSPATECWVQVSSDGVTFTPRKITDQSLATALCG